MTVRISTFTLSAQNVIMNMNAGRPTTGQGYSMNLKPCPTRRILTSSPSRRAIFIPTECAMKKSQQIVEDLVQLNDKASRGRIKNRHYDELEDLGEELSRALEEEDDGKQKR